MEHGAEREAFVEGLVANTNRGEVTFLVKGRLHHIYLAPERAPWNYSKSGSPTNRLLLI